MRALRYDFVDSGCGDFGLLGDGSICHSRNSFLLLVVLVLGFDRRQAALVNALVKLALAFAGATIRLAVEELDHLFFVIHPYADGVEHVPVATLVTVEDLDGLGGCCVHLRYSLNFVPSLLIVYPILSQLSSIFAMSIDKLQKLVYNWLNDVAT